MTFAVAAHLHAVGHVEELLRREEVKVLHHAKHGRQEDGG